MLRDVLIIGTIVAVVIILLRLILGSPIIQRIRETFVSGSHTTNKYTECPPDSKMYMFQGKAFCCSGNIDYQADSAAGSCKTVLTGSMPAANNVFCTLGPTTSDGIVNCIETKAGHGAGKPTSKLIEEAADKQAFLVRALGMSSPSNRR